MTGLNRHYIPLTVTGVIGVLSLALTILLALRVDRAKDEFAQVEKQLARYRSEVWHLEKINRSQLNEKLTKERLRFPAGENAAVLIGEVNEAAKRHGVTIVSMNPKQKVPHLEEEKEVLSSLDRVPIDMTVTGTYEALAMFLSEFDHLEHGLVRVEKFSLAPTKPNEPELNLTLTAELFVKKESEQDVFASEAKLKAPVERIAHKSRSPEVGRNPFVGKDIRPVIPLAIEGIIYDPEAPMVLVDGDVKKVGDRVHDAVIVEILPDSVLFQRDQEQIRVRLQQE
ncbi:MAG: hypothetical protein A3G87_08235 [Omnitrophica bacterium RIFCSPLOWO2_12_FULL_50_11]|nr:MAG: hypothetical protein A3G87_08235 [Omnitrophica bacterium RIFCSPLOWO2_12_FULL_50_11]